MRSFKKALLALSLALYVSLTAGQELHINDASTWRQIAEVHVNDSGTWRQIQEIYVNDGGTWRLVYQFFAITNPFSAWDVWADEAPGNTASASISINSDGTVSQSITGSDAGGTPGSGNWGSPTTTGIGANYWLLLTATSGTFTTNGASSCTSLASNVSASKSGSTSSASVTYTIDIYSDSGCTTNVLSTTGNLLRFQHTL